MHFRHAMLINRMLLVLDLLVKDDRFVRRGPALPRMPVSSLHVARPGFQRFEYERPGPVPVVTSV